MHSNDSWCVCYNLFIIYVLINACVRVCTFYVYGNCNILIPVQVEWRVELNPSPLLWCTPTLTPKLKSAVSFSHNNLCYSISLFSRSLSIFLFLLLSLLFPSFLLSFSLCCLLTIQSLEAIFNNLLFYLFTWKKRKKKNEISILRKKNFSGW